MENKMENKKTSMLSFEVILSSIGIAFILLGIITIFTLKWNQIPSEAKIGISIIPSLVGLTMLYLYLFKEEPKEKKNRFGIFTTIVVPLTFIATSILINNVFNLNYHNSILVAATAVYIPVSLVIAGIASALMYIFLALSAHGFVFYGEGLNQLHDIVTGLALISPFISIYVISKIKKEKEYSEKVVRNFSTILYILNVILILAVLGASELLTNFATLMLLLATFTLTRYALTRRKGVVYTLYMLLFGIYAFTHVIYKEQALSFMNLGYDKLGKLIDVPISFSVISIILLSLNMLSIMYLARTNNEKEENIQSDFKVITASVIFTFIASAVSTHGNILLLINWLLVGILVSIGIINIYNGIKYKNSQLSTWGAIMVVAITIVKFASIETSLESKAIFFMLFGGIFMISARYIKKRFDKVDSTPQPVTQTSSENMSKDNETQEV